MFTANMLFLFYFIFSWERTTAEGLAILWQQPMGDGTSSGLGKQQEVMSFLSTSLPQINQMGEATLSDAGKCLSVIRNKTVPKFPGKKKCLV